MKASRIKEWIDDKCAWSDLESAVLGYNNGDNFESKTGLECSTVETNEVIKDLSNGDPLYYIILIEDKLFRWEGHYQSLNYDGMDDIRTIKEVQIVEKTVTSYEPVEE